MSERKGGPREIIANLGGGIAFIAVLSLVLHFFGRDLKAFELFERWGPETGLAIRIGMIVIGVAIYFIFRQKSGDAPQ